MTAPARLFLLAAAFALCAAPAAAASPAERLAAYGRALEQGDPSASSAFLADEQALVLAAASREGEAVRAKAEAVKDLRDLLALPWDEARANNLSDALAVRVDAGKPLLSAGVGPEPEKVLEWVARYRKDYPASKRKTLERAVRKWEVVFGTASAVQNMEWGHATWMSGSDVNLTRENWLRMTLAKRNAVLAKLAAQDDAFLQYSEQAAKAKKKEDSYSADIAAARAKLTPAQQAELDRLGALSGMPREQRVQEQLAKLGEFFDGGSVAGDRKSVV